MCRYAGSSHAFLVNGLYFLSVGLTVLDSLGIGKRIIEAHRAQDEKDQSWFRAVRHVLQTDVDHETREYGASRYEMIGLTESEGIVFSLGDDEDEHRHHRVGEGHRDLVLQHYPSRGTPSRSSTGSDGTLHESPLRDESPNRMKPGQEMGAYDEHRPSTESEEERATWQQEGQSKMSAKRFGEICLTWVRRAQVVLAYVTVLSGFVIYTVRPTC